MLMQTLKSFTRGRLHMSAFTTAAAATKDSVAGIFGVVSADPLVLKADVVAGIKQSLSISNGLDAAPTLAPRAGF